MDRKRFLPLSSALDERRPTVDAVRRRLGGRAQTEPGTGEVVALSVDGALTLGVVLFVQGDTLEVCLDRGRVRRTLRAEASPVVGLIPPATAALAADVRIFAAMSEGQRVRYEGGEGTLIEKCRFGALVLRDDGVVVGVGFRRLRPAAGAAERHTN